MVDGVRESLQQGREGDAPEGMSDEQRQGLSGVTRVMMMRRAARSTALPLLGYRRDSADFFRPC